MAEPILRSKSQSCLVVDESLQRRFGPKVTCDWQIMEAVSVTAYELNCGLNGSQQSL